MTKAADEAREKRYMMQLFDNLHKIITYITGAGVVWLITTVDTNQNNALIMQTKLEAIERQVNNALNNRYTSADALKDMNNINYRFQVIEGRLGKVEQEQIARTVPVRSVERIDDQLSKHMDDESIHRRNSNK